MDLILRFVPFAFVAFLATLIVLPLVRGRISLPKRTPRPPKKRHLRAVDPQQMDRELNDLLKRR